VVQPIIVVSMLYAYELCFVGTYLASTILPFSFDSAARIYLLVVGQSEGEGNQRTMQCVVELSQRHNSPLNVLARVEMLLRLLIAFLQIDFYRHHLQRVSMPFCIESLLKIV